MFNESKKRYKMYKSGKIWVSAPILFFGVALGSTSVAKADQIQVNDPGTSTVQTQQSKQNSFTSSQKQTVTLSSKEVTADSKTNTQSIESSSSVKNQSNLKQKPQNVTNFATVSTKTEQTQPVQEQKNSTSISATSQEQKKTNGIFLITSLEQ